MKNHIASRILSIFLLTGGLATAGSWVDSYWPLNDGDTKTFVYNVTNQLTMNTVDDGGGEYEIDDDSPDGSAAEFYQNTSTGIYLDQASINSGWINVYFNPPVLLVNDNMLQNGGSANTSTTVSQSGIDYPATYKISISQAGTVVVPAGTFANCRSITVTETATVPGQGTVTANAMTAVLAPSVGIIKKLVSQGVWADLVSGTVGGTDVAVLATGPPVVTIKTPANGQRITTADNNVAVIGSVSGYAPGMQVFYQINSGPWANALVVGTNWSGSVQAQAGTNTVNAYALDSVGRSSPTQSVLFHYVLSAPLTVFLSGEGSVRSNYDGQLLQIGQWYSMTAAGSNGFAFTNWTDCAGTVVTNKPQLTFLMASNLCFTANFIDVTGPIVSITNPIKTGGKWSNSVFCVSGKAKDNVEVSNVWCQLNNSGWNLASTTNNWANWTYCVTLTPGSNTVRAYAMDTSGNDSLTNSVALVYILSAPLTVRTNGEGGITPAYNDVLLQIGNAYSMTAKSAKGFGFVNWTDGLDNVITNGATLKFIMASNLTFVANFVDTNKPTLTITNPIKSGEKWSNAVFTVSGTATDNVAVSNVWVSLNGGSWTSATLFDHGSNWTEQVTLIPGTNTVAAYAVDSSGNLSLTNTVKLDYVLSAPLTVQIVGDGTLTPNYNGQFLAIGSSYAMKATGTNGFAFYYWSGGVPMSADRTLTFTMVSNLTIIASFKDVTPPVKPTITFPTANQKWSNSVITVTGKASDNVGVAQVLCQINGTGWNPVLSTNGWTNWTAKVTLTLGANVVQAYAVDAAGNRSLTNSVNFECVSIPTNYLSGLTAALSSTDETNSSTITFGPSTFSRSMLPGQNLDNNSVGSYTYAWLSTNTALLTLSSTAPPDEVGTSKVALTFTTSLEGVYITTNHDGTLDSGVILFSEAMNFVPASSPGHTIIQDFMGCTATNVNATGTFTSTGQCSGNTFKANGTFTWTPYSPGGGLSTWKLTSSASVGSVGNTIYTWSTPDGGSFFQYEVSPVGAVTKDFGTFTFQ